MHGSAFGYEQDLTRQGGDFAIVREPHAKLPFEHQQVFVVIECLCRRLCIVPIRDSGVEGEVPSNS